MTELTCEPHLHLDQLLDMLSRTPDGFSTKRANIPFHVYEDLSVSGWQAEVVGSFVEILPDYACGFHEFGDGKVLTAITGRIRSMKASFRLETSRNSESWHATVQLEAVCDQWPRADRAASEGVGAADAPGVAVLIAYLRAWGTLA